MTLYNFFITLLFLAITSSCQPQQSPFELKQIGVHAPAIFEESIPIRSGQSFSSFLKNIGLKTEERLHIIKAAREFLDFRSLNAGTPFKVTRYQFPLNEIRQISLPIDTFKRLNLKYDEQDKWKADLEELPIELKQEVYYGTILSSFWDSAVKNGLSPELIDKFAEIFAWKVDFSREIRPADFWSLVVESKMVEGKRKGEQKILAAYYHGQQEQYHAIRYPTLSGKDGFFNLQGQNLKGKFLKAPLKYSRVSSGFSRRRFHPILRQRRAHRGIDYAARKGTPVRSIGDGRVTFAGWQRGGGKTVIIRHNGRYATAYKHLHRIGKKIKKGARVFQGQMIGQVGSTGLATGPHLHFEFLVNGHHKDPSQIKFIGKDHIAAGSMPDFSQYYSGLVELLPKNLEMAYQQTEQSENQKF